MAKWTHRKTEQLIRGLEAVMTEVRQKDRVSTSQVLRVRDVLEPLTVSPLDKGGKQLLVECGLLYKERLRVGMVDADEYGEMEGSVEDIMKEMKRDYSACALDRLAPWGEECVPPTVGMPKHKAPKEMTRFVNSYAKGPARVAIEFGMGSSFHPGTNATLPDPPVPHKQMRARAPTPPPRFSPHAAPDGFS